MKILILSLLFIITTATTHASECKVMEYSVRSPAMRTFAENNTYRLAIESDVVKMLNLRGYTPLSEHNIRHHYDGTDQYCILQVTVHEWPASVFGNANEVKTTVKIMQVDGDIGNIIFRFTGEYQYALPAIPKQQNLK